MSKIDEYALSHTRAYVNEIVSNYFDMLKETYYRLVMEDSKWCKPDEFGWRGVLTYIKSTEDTEHTLDVKGLNGRVRAIWNDDRPYNGYNSPDVSGFYRAMKKVIQHTKGDEHPVTDHGGTECRGWYRVWGELTERHPYFCSMDSGRDGYMAEQFYKSGAITKRTYDVWRFKFTAKLISYDFYRVKHVTEHQTPEEIDAWLDYRLVKAAIESSSNFMPR